MATFRESFRAMQHRNYRLIFISQMVSMVGTWAQSTAQGWLVYRLSGDPALLGLIFLVALAPAFLLTGLGGAVADRVDPKRLAFAVQFVLLLQALLLGLLTLSGQITVPLVFALAVMQGLAGAFDMPAGQVLVARSVPKEDLPNAIALNSSLFHSSRILGPALAGLVTAAWGEGWAFNLNALSYVAALVGILMLRLPPKEPGAAKRSILHELLEGLRFVNDSAHLRVLFALLFATTFLAMPYTVLMPAIVKDVLHAGPRELGWIMGVSGVGATLGALRLASLDRAKLPSSLLLALGGLAVFLPAFAASRLVWLSALLIVPLSFSMVSANTANNTLVQMELPDRLRGRVMALYGMAFMGALPLGGLAGGLVARHLGAPWVLGFGGLGCALALLGFAPWIRHLRKAKV